MSRRPASADSQMAIYQLHPFSLSIIVQSETSSLYSTMRSLERSALSPCSCAMSHRLPFLAATLQSRRKQAALRCLSGMCSRGYCIDTRSVALAVLCSSLNFKTGTHAALDKP